MPIYAGDRKAALYKGDYCPAEMYKGGNKVAGWTEQPKPVPCAWENTYNETVDLVALGRGEQGELSGKNLFNPANVLNGYITTKIINSAATVICWIKCSPNTTYTVSKLVGERFVVAETIEQPSQGVDVYNVIEEYTSSSITVTTTQNAQYLIAWIINSNVETTPVDKMLASVQIEIGAAVTPYEPYCGGIPSPNPSYPQLIVGSEGVLECEGRNLFDIDSACLSDILVKNQDGSFTLSYTDNGRFSDRIPVNIPKDTTVTFYRNLIDTNTTYPADVQLSVRYTDLTSTIIGFQKRQHKQAIVRTFPQDVLSIGLYAESNTPRGTYQTFKDFQIIRGIYTTETIPPYQPYRPPTAVTIPTLRAIPDGSGGWVCRDEMHNVGGGWYEVVRNVGVKEFDGTENWVLGKYPTDASTQFYTANPTDMGMSVNKTINSHFTNARIVNGSSVGDSYNIYPALSTGLTTIDELLPWIATQKSAGTPMTIWYDSAEPTTERVYLGDLKSYPQYTGLTVQGDYPPDVTGTAKVCGVQI